MATIRSLADEAFQYLQQEQYQKASELYQQAIEEQPEIRSNYWYLGLALLLQGQEAEAQITWMLVIGEGDDTEVEQWTAELVEILQTEAKRLEDNQVYDQAWAIRQHLREIDPQNLNNLCQILLLCHELNFNLEEYLAELEIINLLKVEPVLEVDFDILMKILHRILEVIRPQPKILEFVESCFPHVKDSKRFINTLGFHGVRISHNLHQPTFTSQLMELGVRLAPENPDAWGHLAVACQDSGYHERGIEAAKKSDQLWEIQVDRITPERIFSNFLVIRALMNAGGYWDEAVARNNQHEALILGLARQQPGFSDFFLCCRMYTSAFYFPYFEDNLRRHRYIHNQLAKTCQVYINQNQREPIQRYRQQAALNKSPKPPEKKLKLGYLSGYFNQHSVGWLARWLLEYHNREKYEIHGYFLNYRNVPDPLQEWYVSKMDIAHRLGLSSIQCAEQIHQDEIDILIDLDSLTLDLACGVVAVKPAPIQVTWLGWDASGISTIDYTIADPYVLPENAQDYYSETIWRLPQTYVAVDGFEVGVPNLRRDALDIPSDAVVYFSAQRGFKRHRDTARSQIKILKEVPNSYFLVKGVADRESIQKFFFEIAEEEGVSCDRLRFLPMTNSEAIHRANLAIADVVLDTYPYNGATTTLEALWMGVPLVTQVGEQFSSRNSYTMMINAGIEEGIAWTTDEYIEWGVRLGKDPALRQKIAWKLHQSRQTAPVWNAKQFTREMEKAYTQMWERYLDS